MRTAILVDQTKKHAADAASRLERASLRDAFSRLGFRVSIVDDVEAQLDRALAEVGKDDTVLVHVRGVLASGALLHAGDAGTIALRALSAMVMAREASSALLVAELRHAGDAGDALAAAERVEEIRGALDVPGRTHAALVAVHAASSGAPALAFTRLVLRVAEEKAAEGAATLTEVVARMRAMPESQAAAQSFTLLRGAGTFEIAKADAASLQRPAIEPLLALADSAMERREYEQALAGYRAALVFVGDDQDVRALVFSRIGGAEKGRGRTREAQRAFERALAAQKGDRTSLDALIAMATDGEDWPRVVELSRERASLLETKDEKVDELFAVARVLLEKQKDIAGATLELEKARAIDPSRDDIVEGLRRAYRVMERWPSVIEMTGALADTASSPHERAARRAVQAQLTLEHLHDDARAIQLYEAALEDDPTHDEALEVVASLRTARGELAALKATLKGLVPRLVAAGEPERAKDVAGRLDALTQGGADATSPGTIEVVIDAEAALRAIDAVDNAPHSAVMHASNAEQLIMSGDEESALGELETAAVRAPLTAATHARLFALHVRKGRTDRAYLSALALEELQALEAEHRAFLDEHRPDGLRVRTRLDATLWQHFRAPGSDEILESLLRAIGRAAIAANNDERRGRKKLISLHPEHKLPETSTASIVQSFQWAARALGVDCPGLYLMEEVPGDIAAVPALDPSTALGPGVLRGLSTKDLAFLTGRHLTYYRPEHAVLVHFPTLPDLTALLLAALQLAYPAMAIPPQIAQAVSGLRTRIARGLTDGERSAASVAVKKLDARGGRVDLGAWIRSVELTAGRAGLLLCGDLRTAMGRIRAESRAVAQLSVEDKRKDLLAFCASPVHAELRERLMHTASASTPPPPPASVPYRLAQA